jgi:hypothetical protein
MLQSALEIARPSSLHRRATKLAKSTNSAKAAGSLVLAPNDEKLRGLIREFEAAHAALKAADTPGSKNDTKSATPAEKRAYKRWERALDVASAKADAVLSAPTDTLWGMLLKIKVAGFQVDHPPEYCKGPLKQTLDALENWSVPKFHEHDPAYQLIVSLRADIKRMIGDRSKIKPDPIFAVLQQHRAATEAFNDAEVEGGEVDEIYRKAYRALRSTKPTTMRGWLAFIRHLETGERAGGDFAIPMGQPGHDSETRLIDKAALDFCDWLEQEGA